MVDTFFNQILFLLSLIFILYLPGQALLLAVFGKSQTMSSLERFVASFGLGLVAVDFICFLYSKFNWIIAPLSAFLGIGIFILVCLAIFKFRKFSKNNEIDNKNQEQLFSFSKKQLRLILVLLLAIFLVKTAYLYGTVLPTATDMGHHMYWAKEMAESGKLPTYDGMPDFIIGEHIIFGLVAIFSGADFFGAFPVLLLYLFNLLGILAIFLLVLRIFRNQKIAILTLLFLGALFAVSSPQAKFVSGGVIGNTLGNFLLPLAFYFYVRAFEFLKNINFQAKENKSLKKEKAFLSLAVFLTFGLFYTHHLTAFIFLFVVFGTILIYFVANFQEATRIGKELSRLVFSPWILGTFALGLIFFFFVFVPTYVQGSAVETAVGTPSKSTRTGLSLNNLKSTVGNLRLGMGFAGIIFLLLAYKRKNIGYALILGWSLMLLLMSTRPDFLLIDLPSSRVGNYLSFPFAILAAFSFWFVFSLTKEKVFFANIFSGILPRFFLQGSFLVFLSGLIFFGISDSVASFKSPGNYGSLFETFRASEYLVEESELSDIILKDHNYLTGDTWMKLFFMRGYRYPLSRSYFKRYEDETNPREMCTLQMISSPASEEAKNCFSETGTNFLVVNHLYDSAQFEKNREFNHIYASSETSIYYKK